MITTRIAAVVVAVAITIGLGARPASAEWFADVFAGLSLTQDHDVKTSDRSVGPAVYEDVHFDKSLAWGGRVGRYFDAVPFIGLGFDFFRYYPYIAGQSVNVRGCFLPGGCGTGRGGTGYFETDVSAISVDLMLRLPLLRSDDAPQGRVQPYIAIGPPIFVTSITPRDTRQFHNQDGDTELSFGVKAAAGVAVQVYKNLAVFGEYRFTHTSLDFELRDAALNKMTLRTDLDSHSALVGISARW